MSFSYSNASIKAPSASIKNIDASSIRILPKGGGELSDIFDAVKKDIGLTQEQIDLLTSIASTEGKNIPINEDGTFATTIGRTYVVESDTDEVLITNANNKPLCQLTPAGQVGFVANTSICKSSTLNCTVTEVFRCAAPLTLSGGGISIGELPKGYIPAAFLESTCAYQSALSATSYIAFKMPVEKNMAIRVKCAYLDSSDNATVFAEKVGTNRNSVHLNWGWSPRGTKWLWGTPSSSTHYNLGTADLGTPYIIEANQDGFYVNNVKKLNKTHPLTSMSEDEFYLFHTGESTAYGAGETRIFYFRAWLRETVYRDFVAAITPSGNPCMFDKVAQQAYLNSGAGKFVVGMNAEQALNLAKLPATGGSLTISLPSSIVSGSTVTDSAVNSALTAARAKGWSITVRTYEEEATAAASTFGLRRIWVRKTQDENGSYVDAEGIRWQVDWCVTMYTPDDSTPDQHGYELFRSVEAATEYWGLAPYVDPAWEDELMASE